METIREYKTEDFEDLANLNFELAKLEKDWLNLNPKMITLENVRIYLNEKIDTGKIFVCEVNTNIVGFVSGKIKDRDESFKNRKYVYIDDVYVMPEFRRNGIATKLIKRMEKYAKEKGIHEVILNVSEKNSGVLDFYKKIGYHIVEYMFQKVD